MSKDQYGSLESCILKSIESEYLVKWTFNKHCLRGGEERYLVVCNVRGNKIDVGVTPALE